MSFSAPARNTWLSDPYNGESVAPLEKICKSAFSVVTSFFDDDLSDSVLRVSAHFAQEVLLTQY